MELLGVHVFSPSISLPEQTRLSFSSFVPSPPEQTTLATPAGETTQRTDVQCVVVETTVERMSNQGENLGFDLFPFLGAGGRADIIPVLVHQQQH